MRARFCGPLALLCGIVPAQESITFNIVHQNQVDGPAVGFSVKEVPTGYLVFSDQRGWTPSPQDPFTTLFSADGTFLTELDFAQTRYCNFGRPDPVARMQSGGFAAAITVFGWTSVIDSLYLYRFNEDGDTLFTRFLGTDTTFGVRKCIESANGDLLFTGLHEPPKEQFCLRTDAQGGIVSWFAFPGFDGSGIAEDASGDIYLSGQWIYPNPRGSLIKCDAFGAVEWFVLQLLGPATRGVYRTVLPLSDGHVLVMGTFTQYVNPFPDLNYGHVVCYSGEGDLLWQDTARSTTGSALLAEVNDAFQRSDGTILTAGSYTSQETGGHGFVRAYSPVGDVLWDSEFTHYDTVAATGTHQIWDIEPTSDGGMVLTGWAEHFGQTPHVKLWLVKLDSMGCLVPGCNTVGVTEQATNLKDGLRVAPNPVVGGGSLVLVLSNDVIAAKELRWVLVSSSGQLVGAGQLPSGQREVRIAVPRVSPGAYYLHLASRGTWLAGSKLVVE